MIRQHLLQRITATCSWGSCRDYSQGIDVGTAQASSSTDAKHIKGPHQSSSKSTKKSQSQTGPGGGSKVATTSAAAPEKHVHSVSLVEQLQLQHGRCRLEEYYKNILTRELLLKLNLKNPLQVPAVKKVELSIHTKDVLGRPAAEKHEMLVFGLGLEYVSGQRPVYVIGARQEGGKTDAGGNVPEVKVTITGSRVYPFLEKLMMLVMPAQLGFTGIRASSLTADGRLQFRLDSMLNYPDFEEVYELFDKLRAMHITLHLSNCPTPAVAAVLLSGLSFPMRVAEKAEVPAAAAPVAVAVTADEDPAGQSAAAAS